jgi:hypothetical protein
MSVSDKIYKEAELLRMNFKEIDDVYKESNAFVKENFVLSGEPQLKITEQNLKNLIPIRAEKFAELNAQIVDKDSTAEKIGAIGRSGMETLASTVGTAFDISQSIANTIGIDKGDAMLGSKNLSKGLQAVNLGFYEAQPSRLLQDIDQDPATLGDMPPSTRPYAVGGEAFMTSAEFLLPISLAARGKQIAGIRKTPSMYKNKAQMIADDIVNQVVDNPRMYYGLEGSIAGLSAYGEGLAEALRPGDPNARLAGALSPIAITSLPMLSNAAMQGLNYFSRGSLEAFGKKLNHFVSTKLQGEKGTKKIAADIINTSLQKEGGDPLALARQMGKQKDLPSDLSAGQITKDPLLLGIEGALIKQSKGELDETLRKQTEKQMQEIDEIYRNVIGLKDADPDTVNLVVNARREMLNFSTNAFLRRQEHKLLKQTKISQKIGKPEFVAENAQKVKSILKETQDALAKTEKQAWQNVPRNLNATAYETIASIQKQIDPDELGFELFERIKLPSSINKLREVQNIGEGFDMAKVPLLSTGDLLDAKSVLGDQYRALAISDNPDAGKLMRAIQELRAGIYNDLNKVKGFEKQLKLANQATTNEYNFYDIPIIRDLTKKTRQGATFKEPDIVLEQKLLSSPSTQSRFHSFNDLFRAASFDDMTAGKIADPLAKFYYAAANASAMASGEINPKTLNNFINKNQDGLRKLGLYDVLQDQENQVVLYKALQKQAKNLIQNQDNGMVGKMFNVADVSDITDSILFKGMEAQRGQNLQKAFNVVRNKKVQGIDTQKATEAFQQSVIESIIAKAQKNYTQGQGDNAVSGLILDSDKLNEILNKKINGKTLRQDLLRTKVLSEDQVNALSDLSKKAKEFENLLNVRSGKETALTEQQRELLDKALSEDMMLDTMGRLAGASLASFSVFGGAIGHDLIVAHIGSKLGRSIISKMPNLKIQKMLVKAVQDPSLMKELLEQSGKQEVKSLKRNRDLQLLAKLQLNDIIDYREAYEIEGRDSNNKKLFARIDESLKEGNTPIKIMEAFEKASRQPKFNVGSYKLDTIQGYLNLSDADRMKALRNIAPVNKKILKRTGRFR